MPNDLAASDRIFYSGECAGIARGRILRQDRDIATHAGCDLALVLREMKELGRGRGQHRQYVAKAEPCLCQLAKLFALVVVRQEPRVGSVNEPAAEPVKLESSAESAQCCCRAKKV